MSWHITKKFGEKLSDIYYKKSNFKKDMKGCIRYMYKVEDFEKNGSMNTTSHSEDFVLKDDRALASILKRENDEDFESEHKYRIVNDDALLLKYASKVYTRNIFQKFKEEWKKVKDYKVEDVNYDLGTYIVKHQEKAVDRFQVNFDLQNHEGKCECQHFKFVGIICGHILKVFICKDVGTAETNKGYQLFIKAIKEEFEQIYSLNIKTRTPVDTSPKELNICNEESSQFVLSNPNVSII
ncbi:protein FAR1-RELATED SEQUENCE 5-like [Olea europaea var. sylvestris]|uniref:protein FAR1-RELATED SEQUENCE 5-like n=1 Tax=Olea europaea var. sylvestris TaxID=158386 RepID=UPI000C1D8187|nr:protein FAR1-RELATED SEQUENCE 5-like [Olea europaea var. sylvestris]